MKADIVILSKIFLLIWILGQCDCCVPTLANTCAGRCPLGRTCIKYYGECYCQDRFDFSEDINEKHLIETEVQVLAETIKENIEEVCCKSRDETCSVCCPTGQSAICTDESCRCSYSKLENYIKASEKSEKVADGSCEPCDGSIGCHCAHFRDGHAECRCPKVEKLEAEKGKN